MSFAAMILRNMRRRFLRVGLTVVAMAVAVTAFVALIGISDGFRSSAIGIFRFIDIDLIVVRAGGQERLNSALEYSLNEDLRKLPGVRRAAALLTDVISLEQYGVYGAGVQGLEANSPLFTTLGNVEGHILGPEDQGKVLLGSILAQNLGKHVGDEIIVYEDESFRVAGVYKSYNVVLDGLMVMLLSDLQRLMGRPGQVTGFGLTVEDPSDFDAIEVTKKAVVELNRGLKVMPVRDHVETLTQFQVTNAMSWLTASIAMVIGGISVLNTMFMSVLERTQEIGILRAIGWGRGRILRMVLWESVVMSLMAAVLGSLAGMAVVKVLSQFSLVNGLIEGRISWHVIVQGFVLVMLVGLIGAVYPAYRSAKLLPTEALHYE